MEQLRGRRRRTSARGRAVGAVALAVAGLCCRQQNPGAQVGALRSLTVYAAADLAFAFKDLTPPFERANRARVTLVFGSTGTLSKQIENGAPADVFFAANDSFLDPLAARELLVPGTRTIYAQGRLVLATARAWHKPLRTVNDLEDPAIRHVALANPAHAPYGLAAREAMERTGIWSKIQPKLVYAENVRQALQFVQSGAAEAALLSRSVADAPEIEWVPIDAALHRPLDQSVAVLARSHDPALARTFVRFVNGPDGRAVMKRYGFLLPGEF